MLVCPKCRQELIKNDKTYRCENNHCYDISKQGYTTLLLKSCKQSGDNKLMVNARTEFLNKHYYDNLLNFINVAIKEINPKCIVDAGCGEGYYTNHLLVDDNCDIFGFDMSKDALKYASKHSSGHANYFLSSIFDLPISDESCDLLLNIFAPCASYEFKRIMSEDAILIKVDPASKHLYELKEELYENPYLNPDKTLKDFNLIYQQEITYKVNINNEDLNNLITMTPYVYKSSKEALDKLKKLENLNLTISFMVSFYKK